MTTEAPSPNFDHLLRLTDSHGTFADARFTEPQRELGYRTDDMARVLVVATREPDAAGPVNGLAGLAIRFLNEAQAYSGACRSRMDGNGRWIDEPSTEDHWGRCLWGLGTAAAHSGVGLVRRLSVIQFGRAAQARSTSARAMAFAAVGAAELLAVDPEHQSARRLTKNYVASLASPGDDSSWPWPEPQLADSNAVLAEAMIAAGVALEDMALQQRGLELLGWLLEHETRDGHLSPSPVEGRGPDGGPGFDQQPIEVAAMADACARAAVIDAAATWPDGVAAAAAWFRGSNDAGQVMWDPVTGGGYDGLLVDGVNQNQGAESTTAVISTMQHARRFSVVPQ